MIVSTVKNYALIAVTAALGVSMVLGWGWRKDAQLADARIAPLEQGLEDAVALSEAHLQARLACSREMARVRRENAQALRDAQQAATAAKAERDSFRDRLGSAPAGCDALLQAPVCPALQGY